MVKNPQKAKCQHCWKLGMVNIRTGSEKDQGAKIYALAKECETAGLTLVGLQEVKWKDEGCREIVLDNGSKYMFYWHGHQRKPEAGVSILGPGQRCLRTSRLCRSTGYGGKHQRPRLSA